METALRRHVGPRVVEAALRRHVEARVAAIVAELGADPRRTRSEARFEDLGLDTLDVAELVQILEIEFDLRLFALAYGHVHTIGNVTDLVVSHLT